MPPSEGEPTWPVDVEKRGRKSTDKCRRQGVSLGYPAIGGEGLGVVFTHANPHGVQWLGDLTRRP
eukprot:9348360-Prorocentrum_lima.AAC.1